MKTLLVPLLAIGVVASGVVGYQLGRSQAPVSDRIENPPSEELQATAGASSRPIADSRPPSGTAATTPHNLPDRIRAVLTPDSPRRMAYEIEQLFADLSAEDVPGILATITAWPNTVERRNLMLPFFVKWAELDGPAALAAAKAFSGRQRAETISSAFTGWAHADPHAAWAAAKSYFEDASPFVVMLTSSNVIHEMAKSDLQAALSAVEALDRSPAIGSAFARVVQAAFESNQMESLLSHTLQLDDMARREQWTSQIFARWGETETEGPLEAMEAITDPSLAKQAMQGFLQGWGQADAEAALSFALANADNDLISESLSPLLQAAMMQGDKSENQALVAHLYEANLLDRFAQTLISNAAFTNPELALDIAEKVSDAEARTRHRLQALFVLANTNFEAARLHVANLPTAAERAALIPNLVLPTRQSPESGRNLAAAMQSLAPSPERTRVIETLLSQAAVPRDNPHPSFLATLKELSEAETGLSEGARELRTQLFGE